MNAHPPLDPAIEGFLLVAREVMPSLGPEENTNFLQEVGIHLPRCGHDLSAFPGMAPILAKPGGQIPGRCGVTVGFVSDYGSRVALLFHTWDRITIFSLILVN